MRASLNHKILIIKILLLASAWLCFSPEIVKAEDIGADFISRGLPGKVRVIYGPGASSLPWEWTALTPVFEYAVESPQMYDPAWPMEIRIKYKDNNNLKQIFIIDALSGKWAPLPSQDVPESSYVKTTLTTTSGYLILLSKESHMTTGNASWYRYKNGNFAASPDFLKGSVLKVTNLANGKSVEVTVNDFGPDRAIHPDRVIDLDRVAFEKIASPSAGIVKVKVEPLVVIRPKAAVSAPVAKTEFTSDVPIISATSAIVFLEDGNRVLFGKEENRVAPLASLTKLVALKTFLDLKLDLKKVVTYKIQDEQYNHLYVKPWESARLTVKDGDTLTIENLLYSAAVGSANNAIETLVRVSGLSRPEFIKRMNSNVKNWGANNTVFIEPTGLSTENISSPSDYAIIVKEALRDSFLEKISVAKSYSFSTINTKIIHRLNNTNQLVRSGNYDIIGSKTGYLDEAGYCLMTKVKTSKGNLILINFGSPTKAANFYDNEQLIRYGLKQINK